MSTILFLGKTKRDAETMKQDFVSSTDFTGKVATIDARHVYEVRGLRFDAAQIGAGVSDAAAQRVFDSARRSNAVVVRAPRHTLRTRIKRALGLRTDAADLIDAARLWDLHFWVGCERGRSHCERGTLHRYLP